MEGEFRTGKKRYVRHPKQKGRDEVCRRSPPTDSYACEGDDLSRRRLRCLEEGEGFVGQHDGPLHARLSSRATENGDGPHLRHLRHVRFCLLRDSFVDSNASSRANLPPLLRRRSSRRLSFLWSQFPRKLLARPHLGHDWVRRRWGGGVRVLFVVRAWYPLPSGVHLSSSRTTRPFHCIAELTCAFPSP